MVPATTLQTSPSLPVAPAVSAFAAALGVEEFLPDILEMTKRLFPSPRRLEVFGEEDPEIAKERYLVLAVDVAGMQVPEAVAAQNQWCRELLESCPPSLACHFRLALELVD